MTSCTQASSKDRQAQRSRDPARLGASAHKARASKQSPKQPAQLLVCLYLRPSCLRTLSRKSMGEPDDPSLLRSVKSKAKALGLRRSLDNDPVLPTSNDPVLNHTNPPRPASLSEAVSEKPARNNVEQHRHGHTKRNKNTADEALPLPSRAAPSSQGHAKAAGASAAAIEPKSKQPMSTARVKQGIVRFCKHLKDAVTHSWIDVLLIFVPIGIAAHVAHLKPEIVFSTNAIAIIPLAGLLAHATEAVAARLGDTLGALLNVSFGNAVELILFIILLAGNQIRVVQAALLGSILANLLLILGMAFLLGGLRFQEQVSFLSRLRPSGTVYSTVPRLYYRMLTMSRFTIAPSLK